MNNLRTKIMTAVEYAVGDDITATTLQRIANAVIAVLEPEKDDLYHAQGKSCCYHNPCGCICHEPNVRKSENDNFEVPEPQGEKECKHEYERSNAMLCHDYLCKKCGMCPPDTLPEIELPALPKKLRYLAGGVNTPRFFDNIKEIADKFDEVIDYLTAINKMKR